MKSRESVTKVVSGVAKFQAEVFPAQKALFDHLKHQQHPVATFFTCADSRIVPNMLLQTGPGEIFTERTPGNIVPKYSDHVGGVTASMEYAVMVLRVPLIIVCGHSDCGVMKALLEPEQTAGMPALQSWMRHALPARERLLREHRGDSKEEQLRWITEYNVLTQLENLRTHPTVEAGLAKGELEIQGWVYDIGRGIVSVADEQTGKFSPLAIPAET
ncbi:MAG TPA: carbonic anhydrase [Terriglobales bacterium]|jgi:carbonic anhydrase